MQTSLYTAAGQPAQPDPIVLAAITDLNAAAAALKRAAYGLAFLNGGVPTTATLLLDGVNDIGLAAVLAADGGGPMGDAIELADMIDGFRDEVARAELQAMQRRAGGALRVGRPDGEAA